MSHAGDHVVRLLSRAECGLCEEMTRALRPHLVDGSVTLEVVEVDSRADWQRRYGLRIPVLLDGWDEVICEGHFDAEALQDWLREQQRRRALV